MCFSRACPDEDYKGECTRCIGPLPCEVEEVFAEEGAESQEDDEE